MDKCILDGIDHYRVTEALFEGVRVILTYRGEPYSPAYVQGISGAAFRIGGICPCAPTCTSAMSTQDLLKLFGYEIEELPLYTETVGIEPKAYAENRLPEVLPRIKAEICAGCPVLTWNAFTTCEWDVVCGFDEAEHQLCGRGSYAGLEDDYAVADETNITNDYCPPFGAILIGEKTGAFDAHEAELASLQEAVRHAQTRKDAELKQSDGWVFLEGIQCYDRWIHDFESPEKKREMGDAYCLGIYHSTHRAAADFVRELAPRYPAAATPLERAAAHFTAEADALDACMPLLWWDVPEGPDAERNAKAVPLLRQAREGYARAIGEIERALALMNK
ncbi:MAG: hypothetical protein JXR84_21240 [Anaerolineae bacterium]|nr:hypothetical protein [Anaerolineae bacterium]